MDGLKITYRNHELRNYFMNVKAVITNKKLLEDKNVNNIVELGDYYASNVVSYSDYYPFGMLMVGRNGGGSYRYSFNGMEKALKKKVPLLLVGLIKL